MEPTPAGQQIRKLEATVNSCYSAFVGGDSLGRGSKEYDRLNLKYDIEAKCRKYAQQNRRDGTEAIMKHRIQEEWAGKLKCARPAPLR